MTTFPAIDRLCEIEQAFGCSEENDRLFFEAMRENYLLQLERQPYLRHLARKSGFSPEDLQDYRDIFRIPPLFVGAMKLHGFVSVSPEQASMVLTSSGTTGQKTRAFFDEDSLRRLETLAHRAFRDLGYTSETPAHYFIFNYDPAKAADLGTAWTAEQKTRFAPAIARHWMIEWDEAESKFIFQPDKWVEEILKIPAREPVRFVGFPAFIHQFVQELLKKRPGFQVAPQSFVIAGGGWKNHLGTTMTHREFARFIDESIGLPAQNVRDSFGMAEHGVPYPACRNGVHHVPVYARVAVRDPLSMAVMPHGREGLLHLLTPYNTAQANQSVLATDLAVLGAGCPCGTPGTYIASLRRGGLRKHKGCAIAAQQILNNSGRK
ncbi:MAG: acyl-protein synthetase LuxE [Syntrophobacteraceae bacterium]